MKMRCDSARYRKCDEDIALYRVWISSVESAVNSQGNTEDEGVIW